MKEALGNLADGQIEFYKSVSSCCMSVFAQMLIGTRVSRRWRSGTGSYRSCSAYGWTFDAGCVSSLRRDANRWMGQYDLV
jgi:hypothetical protein